MKSVSERLSKYSLSELTGLYFQAEKQISRLSHDVVSNVSAYEPLLGTFLEAFTGRRIEKLGTATLEDLRKVSKAENAMNRMEALTRLSSSIRFRIECKNLKEIL